MKGIAMARQARADADTDPDDVQSDDTVVDALRAEASGVLVKDTEPAELIEAVAGFGTARPAHPARGTGR